MFVAGVLDTAAGVSALAGTEVTGISDTWPEPPRSLPGPTFNWLLFQPLTGVLETDIGERPAYRSS